MIISNDRELVVFAFDSWVQQRLEDLKFMSKYYPNAKQCVGSWEGIEERSWLVTGGEFEDICKFFGNLMRDQVCFLRIPQDGRNKPYLEYPDGRCETIGRTFKEVDCFEAKKYMGYTYIIDQQKYFVVE